MAGGEGGQAMVAGVVRIIVLQRGDSDGQQAGLVFGQRKRRTGRVVKIRL